MNSESWDYRDPYEWMDRTSKCTMPPMMIQCVITGSIQGKEYNPNIPETIEEQVEAVSMAYEAGATEVYVHVRNPENVAQSSKNPEDYSRINALIRERCKGMIINNSTGGGPEITVKEKMAALYAENKPDIVSLNPGPFMMSMTLKERKAPLRNPRPEFKGDVSIPVTYGDVYETAKLCLGKGVRPCAEIYHTGHFWVINDLIEKGLLKPPYLMQFIFGFQTSLYPTPWNVLNVLDEVPRDSVIYYPGIGPFQLPMNALGIIIGGHVRVGLKDNVYYRKGELGESTAQQVARIVRIANELNRPVATIAEAREICGLPPAEQKEVRK